MLDLNGFKRGVDEAVEQYPVKKVTLFGSCALGKQTEGSDVDLLVEFFRRTSLFLFFLRCDNESKKVWACPLI